MLGQCALSSAASCGSLTCSLGSLVSGSRSCLKKVSTPGNLEAEKLTMATFNVHHKCEVQFVCANVCCDCQGGSYANVLMTAIVGVVGKKSAHAFAHSIALVALHHLVSACRFAHSLSACRCAHSIALVALHIP